jgi:hypothetical protein
MAILAELGRPATLFIYVAAMVGVIVGADRDAVQAEVVGTYEPDQGSGAYLLSRKAP